ncbi:hypothetical protein HN358_04995 [Candidatus Uhrbacteria bacterium]|jgi:dihydrofolate synthase / folylpolyglutamate synthase|nr:hypothetical protein [Candidatus Uhrbacteria bacterium]MBT7716779.1 hypothetical protein [Candidatus Uhrbacteria bacterium]
MIPQYNETYEKFLSLTNLCEKVFSDSTAELKKSMKRTEQFMEALGSPHKKLKIIHIAGTSGKGSTAYMVHQMLTADKQNVGTYLSPHTTTFLERFQYNDKLLSADDLVSSMNELMDTYQKHLAKTNTPLSFFELSTCLSLFAFQKAGARWCVLETGCGGRWDATNVIPTPEVAIITNIDKDHTELLGNSLAQIAFEKAGIIKKNGTIFCGEVRPNIKKVFMKEAIKNNAALFFIHPPFENIINAEHGEHQQHNASLAIAAAKEINIKDNAIEQTLDNLKRLPCRFETMQQSPQIILDGAHSPAKIAATVKKIKELKKPIHLIFGCAANKDAPQMLKQLIPHVDKVTTTRFQMGMRKAAVPSELLKVAPKAKRAGSFLDHSEALDHAKKQSKNDEVIIATGSLFLTGELRANWISEDQIVKSSNSFSHI